MIYEKINIIYKIKTRQMKTEQIGLGEVGLIYISLKSVLSGVKSDERQSRLTWINTVRKDFEHRGRSAIYICGLRWWKKEWLLLPISDRIRSSNLD